MISTLKVEKPEPMTLIEKIKAEIKKRSQAKAKRMLLKRPRRPPRTRSTRSRSTAAPSSDAITKKLKQKAARA